MFLFWLIVSMPAVCGGVMSEGTPTTWGFSPRSGCAVMIPSRKRPETPARPITFNAAEDLGAFELAQLWADL